MASGLTPTYDAGREEITMEALRDCEECGHALYVTSGGEIVTSDGEAHGLEQCQELTAIDWMANPNMIHVYADVVVTPTGEIITLPMDWSRHTILRETYEAFPEAGIVHHQEVASYWERDA